ncbi:MAG: metal ABC transporter permease [Candidatus Bathyarchaeota archaeon]|nr:metal ABC transporter permease [Candidatus Bathyarchaeum tardum]WGM90580.1 MAG: metal ABC transporter permease [Candidatus Bathyarchaeum tardum]WNZ29347.1 MAG: metal ABC transporter permease [Candidatus Bathyarchaeota archaeon]
MNELLEIFRLFEFQFFQNALLGGTITALACAWVGLFLILRKESMIGDGIAHTAFGGIALGLFLGINPILSALLVSVLAVLGISYMRRKGLAQSDSAIAVMLAVGFSTGLIIISLAGGFNVELFSFLFGSILTIDRTDLIIVSILGLTTIIVLGIFHKELLAMTFDEQSARLMGIPVRPLSMAFNLLVAITIVLSIKVIGVILVVALLVLPGLSALQLNLSFKATTLAAVIFGIVSMTAGILLSAIYSVATSGIIVFTAAGIFIFTAIYKKLE